MGQGRVIQEDGEAARLPRFAKKFGFCPELFGTKIVKEQG